MKRAFRILLLVIAAILILNIFLVALLSNKCVQGRILSAGEEWLKEKTKTELSIGYVGFDLLNGLYVEQVYVEDLSKDTLLYAQALKTDIKWRTLLNLQNIRIKRVELDDFVVHIDKASDSTDFNFQFLIDVFASEETEEDEKSSNPFSLKINEIALKNGWVTYDVHSASESPDTFNASHLSIRDLQLEASFSLAKNGDITAEVERLSFDEKSGLKVANVEVDAQLKDQHLFLSKFLLALPKSKLSLQGDCVLEDLTYAASVRSDSFSLADVRCFAPMLAPLTDSLSISFLVTGQFPAVCVQGLELDYPSLMSLSSPLIKMDDCLSWDSTLYQVKVDQWMVSRSMVDRLMTMMGSEGDESLASYFPVKSQLTYKGSLPDGKIALSLSTPVGSLSADGDFSYKNSAQYLGGDWVLNLSDIALDTLLKSKDFGDLTLNSEVKLDWNMNQLPDVKLVADLPSFSYKNYAYDSLKLQAHYFATDSLSAHVKIQDPNLGCVAWLEGARILSDQPQMGAHAKVSHFSPSKTHWADSLGNACIDVAFSAQVSDFNQLLGEVAIDSLRLERDSSLIHWQQPSVAKHIALADGTRQLSFSSPAMEMGLKGTYDFADLYPAAISVLRNYWPDLLLRCETSSPMVSDKFHVNMRLKEVDDLIRFAGMDLSIPTGASLDGSLSVEDHTMDLSVGVPNLALGKRLLKDVAIHVKADGRQMKLGAGVVADTSASGASELLKVDLHSTIAQNRMEGEVNALTFPDSTFVRGTLPFTVYSQKRDSFKVNMHLLTQKADWILAGYRFGLSSAEIHQLGEKIGIKNIGITLDDNVLLSVDGVASDQLSDTLNIRFDQVNVEPILTALARRHIPLQCTLDGDLYASALLGEKMRFQTNNLRLDTIVYEGVSIGDLTVNMHWNNERKGVLSKMYLTNGGHRVAVVQGVVKPAENRLKMVTALDSLPVDLLTPFISDFVSGTRGVMGANILAEGEFDNIELEGMLFFKDVYTKVNYTGVGYTLSDTIKFMRNKLRMDRFTVKDDHGKRLTLKGDISHDRFKSFKYDLLVNMDNFLLLNNPKAKSNTVSGVFYANAKNVTLQGTDMHLKVRGEFSNGDKTSLNIILPETVTEAQTYDNIVYVQPVKEEVVDTSSVELHEVPFDVDADLSVKLTDQATFYVNVADGTMINGNGNLRIVYKEDNVSIYNRYTVNNGYVKIKLSEIPSKKFTIQEGAYVQFNGDPMKLQFDATACYDLTADLATLSSGFTGMGLSSTRQPVRCGVHASGTLSEMNLTYDITLPKSADNVLQQFNSVITTDDIRIREFAYLIGLGMFYAPNEETQGDEMLTSLASSSLSAALNNALSSVLNDKVTIGTGFSSSDEDFSDVEMNLSVSTKLFNDRLLLSTNLGYQKQATAEENEASFLGDFDAEYLLGKKKVLRVKAYNHTNNDYYRNSSNTQGVGVVFVKEAKTLRGLLPFGKDENGQNLLAPRDTTRQQERRKAHEKK